LDGFVPVGAQVAPRWIVFDDKGELLNPKPAFQFFLTSDSCGDAREALEVNQLRYPIASGEAAGVCVRLMLGNAGAEIRRDADVQLLEPVREDVHVSVLGHGVDRIKRRRPETKANRG